MLAVEQSGTEKTFKILRSVFHSGLISGIQRRIQGYFRHQDATAKADIRPHHTGNDMNERPDLAKSPRIVLDEASIYSQDFPHHQNALRLLENSWTSAMPEGSGLTAGSRKTFEEARVNWGAKELGGFSGKLILEIGPYEGYNTYQFEKLGARVVSIESNSINFMKCLIVKNIFGMSSSFLLGDAIKYLELTQNRADICWLSGVLYHMTDPVLLLKAVARACDAVFIWTHYYDADVIEATPGMKSYFRPERDRLESVGDSVVKLHYRSYDENKTTLFAGGIEEYSYWMSKQDIFKTLNQLGLTKIKIGVDNPNLAAGPSTYFLALR